MKSTLKRLLCIIACMALVMAFSTNAMAAGKIKDGNYNVGYAFAGGSGKVQVTSATLIVSGGKMQVKFTFDSTYYTKVVAGGATYKNQSPGSNSTFTIPVSALDTAIPFTGTTVKMIEPHDIDYTLTLKSSSLPATAFEQEKPAQQTTPSSSAEKITVVEVKSEDTGASITKDVVEKIKKNNVPVELTTKTGTVVFDETAAKSIFGNLSNSDVKFEMKDIKNTDSKFKDSDYDMVLDCTIKDASDKNLFAEGSQGKAKITVPYDVKLEAGESVKVLLITDSGEKEVEAKYDADAKTVTFEAEHFSQYGIKHKSAEVQSSSAAAPTETTGNNGGVNAGLIIGIVVVVLAVAGGVAYFVVQNKKKGN